MALVNARFHGLQFAHIVTDLWTEEHTTTSYGSIVQRFVDTETTIVPVVPPGVSMTQGKHNNENIHRWVVDRLRHFGLEKGDLCSTTTDSGANVSKAMRRFGATWLPRFSHALHNSVQYALGVSRGRGRDGDHLAAVGPGGGTNDADAEEGPFEDAVRRPFQRVSTNPHT